MPRSAGIFTGDGGKEADEEEEEEEDKDGSEGRGEDEEEEEDEEEGLSAVVTSASTEKAGAKLVRST